jgi:hypothetical protein
MRLGKVIKVCIILALIYAIMDINKIKDCANTYIDFENRRFRLPEEKNLLEAAPRPAETKEDTTVTKKGDKCTVDVSELEQFLNAELDKSSTRSKGNII